MNGSREAVNMEEKQLSNDACQWTYNQYINGDLESEEFLKQVRIQADLAGQLYDIRSKLGMTRQDLAEFAGLSVQTIEDLEESDYDGDWDEAISRTNKAFQRWINEVIIPAAQMKPEEYSIRVLSAC
jgi:DNA-binding XRE family transcriptional regulator